MAGAFGLVRGGFQGQGAGRLDRLGAGAAVPAPAFGGEQLRLPGFARGRVANLASRVLGLAARRVSADMETAFGHPALLAETFADPSRFNGGCCLAAGWTPVGRTRGFARAGGGWVEHGRPKEVFVRPLAADARSALGGLDEPASWGCGRAVPEPPLPGRMRSLFDHLRQVPEFRSPRGLPHSLASVLAVAAAAKLAGGAGPRRHRRVRGAA